MTVDFERLVPFARFESPEGREETELLREMLERGEAFLGSFEWCREIRERYLGDVAVGRVIAVFLFRIDPGRPEVDEWLWVVIGDVPPAYLVTDDAPNPACALDAYIELMEEWVEAAGSGGPVDDLLPVYDSGGSSSLEPTRELAEMLGSRLSFLRNMLAEDYCNDLRLCK